MKYLIYNTEQEALNANEQIYINMLKAKIGTEKALNVETDREVLIHNKTPQYIAKDGPEHREFPIFGIRNGEENREDGYTTAWSDIRETVDGTFAIVMPEDIMIIEGEDKVKYESSPLLDGVDSSNIIEYSQKLFPIEETME
jgi:hypothetical protein